MQYNMNRTGSASDSYLPMLRRMGNLRRAGLPAPYVIHL